MVLFSRAAARALRRMPQSMALRIRDAIARVAADPRGAGLDVRPLEGREGVFRLRVGEWRVLFRREGDVLSIERIAPRGDAYR